MFCGTSGVGGGGAGDLCGRKYSHKKLPENFSSKLGEIWTTYLSNPQTFACS